MVNTTSNPKHNYYLSDLNSSIKVILDIKTEISTSIFRSVLSFCKQWNIKEIILKIYDLNNAKIFDKLYNTISDTFLFSENDFDFYLQYENLEISIIKEFWKNKEKPSDFLLPYLTHNKNHENQFQSFGTEILRFFEYSPEIITLQPENKKISYTLKNPENVFALFFYEYHTSKDISFQTVDLNKFFNRKNGKVVFPWKISNEIKLFVIRMVYGYLENCLNQKLNYFSEKVLKTYFNFVVNNIENNSTFFKGMYLQPYKVNSTLEESIPISIDLVEQFYDKKGKNYADSAFTFWHKTKNNSYLQTIELLNFNREKIQTTLQKSIKDQSNLNDNRYIFELSNAGKSIQKCGIPIYLFDFANSINDFCLFIDSNNIYPNGRYCKEKEIELRIASSITHHYENKTVNVKCGKLLNVKNSFEEKLWYFNWLISCGITNVIQDIVFDHTELKINLYNNLPTYDPSYLAYKRWLTYLQVITQFASKGKHRCDVLVLYPTDSYLQGNVVELANIFPQLANKGIDFDVIDYSGFVNNNTCKIENKYLLINKETFSILILPGVNIIPGEVLRKIYDYYRAGGTVIAIGDLPGKSTNWDEDNEIESISNEIWFKKSEISSTKFKTNKWGGKGYFQNNIDLLPDIISENHQLLNFQIYADTGNVRVLIKELPTEYYILLFNMSEMEGFKGTLHSKYKGKPFVWDFESNQLKEFHNFFLKDSFLQIPFFVPCKQSRILVLKKQSLKSLPKVLSTNLDEITSLKIKNHKITLTALVKGKGNYEIEVNVFNVIKKLTKNVQNFLPTLTISNSNWIIEFKNTKITNSLGDLSMFDHTYFGTIIYKKIIIISKDYVKDYRLILDLGKLKDMVEIYINEKNLGLHILPPFQIDISDYIIAGDNKFEFRVKNNLSNVLSSLETVEQKNFYIKEFGLYGPVKIIPYKEIEFSN